MALPTITGVYPYPNSNSPERTFYQGYASGATVGVLKCIGTISAAQDFVLTDFMASVVIPTDGATVTVKVKDEPIHMFGAMSTTIDTHICFGGSGLRVSAKSTNTVELLVANASATVSIWARGYFD